MYIKEKLVFVVNVFKAKIQKRTPINEILNTATRDNSDMQYIELDGSTGRNFSLLIID